MNRRTLPLFVVVALLATGFVALTTDEGSADPVSPARGASTATPSAETWRPPSVVLRNASGTSEAGRDATPASVPVSKSLPVPSGAEDGSGRLTVSAPSFIDQGSLHDVVVAVHVPGGARYFEFTLSADPELVELWDASRGGGSPRGEAAFEAFVDGVANRIAVKIEREDGWPQDETVNLAVVRIEGVATGNASITVSEVGAWDAAGGAIYIAPASETTQLTVMSGPI